MATETVEPTTMDAGAYDLMPCPCCRQSSVGVTHWGEWRYYVRCFACGHLARGDRTEGGAVAKWNAIERR